MALNSNKSLSNTNYFDDGMGSHIENGEVDCKTLFINGINSGNIFDASYSYIEGQIADLTTAVNNNNQKLTICSFDPTTFIFLISGDMKVSGAFSVYIDGAYVNVGSFMTATNIILTSYNSSINSINTKLTDVSRDVGLGAFVLGGTSDMRLNNKLYLQINGSAANINSYIENNITNITSLISKTSNISVGGTTTTIGGNLVINNIDGFTKAKFDNSINFTYDLSSNAQTQIDGAYVAAAAASAAGVAAGAAAYTTACTFATGAVAAQTAIQLITDGAQDGNITGLQDKLATYTLDTTLGNNIVTIASRVNANSFGNISFYGGITQTHNDDNTFIGNTYFRNFMRFNDGFGIDIQDNGGMTCSGTMTIGGNMTASGATTNINSTTIQLGTSTAATLNIYANSNIYATTNIRNNLTSASGTISPYLKIQNIATNSNQFKLQGLIIGKEQIFGTEQSNCNLGYNWVSDGSTSNYGYFGLNANTAVNNTLECVRFSPTKVTVSNGSFETNGAAQILGDLTANVIKNNGASNMTLTSTGATYNMVLTSAQNLNLFANSGAIKLNSGTLELATNQIANANNIINIGTTYSNSTTNIQNGVKLNSITPYNTINPMYINGLVISLGVNEGAAAINSVNIGTQNSQTVCNIPNGILTNNITTFFTNSSLNIDAKIVNIGTNQPTASANQINIGNVFSGSLISLNGIVSTIFPIQTTNIFSQF